MAEHVIRTRSGASHALVAMHAGEPRIVGYAHSTAAAEPRARRLHAVVAPIWAGKVTVEVHTCPACSTSSVFRFSGPGGVCLDCELAARFPARCFLCGEAGELETATDMTTGQPVEGALRCAKHVACLRRQFARLEARTR